MESPQSGENEHRDVLQELQQVHGMLAELESMQPVLHEDIGKTQADIDRLAERLAAYDTLAEEQRSAGDLEDRNAFTVAKAMNDIAGDLESFIQDKELLLDTRMTLERTIADLREEADDLLKRVPKGTIH